MFWERCIEKEETVNLKTDDDKYFQYAITISFNHEEIKKIPKELVKLLPFVNRLHYNSLNYTPVKYDWKIYDKITSMLFLIFYIKKIEICPA